RPVATSFFFHDSAPSLMYTLSLHDALPIFDGDVAPHAIGVLPLEREKRVVPVGEVWRRGKVDRRRQAPTAKDRRHMVRHADLVPDLKSTRLNSSDRTISYAVFCLKKNKPRT